MDKHLVLAYMPRDPKGGCFVPCYYKFKHYKGDEMWLHMILDNIWFINSWNLIYKKFWFKKKNSVCGSWDKLFMNSGYLIYKKICRFQLAQLVKSLIMK